MNTRLVVLLAVLFWSSSETDAASLLNVAIPLSGQETDALSVYVDGDLIGQLGYKEVIDLGTAPARQLVLRSASTNEFFAQASLLTACTGSNEPCTALFVAFGGVNDREIRLEPVNDIPEATGRRCTDVGERCRRVINLAPVARPATGQDDLSYRRRCTHRRSDGSSGELLARSRYGVTDLAPGVEIAGRRPLQPLWCSLESVVQTETDLFWSEAHGLEIPPGTTGRFFIIGEGVHQPREVLTMIDTEIVESTQVTIDPHNHFTSPLIWIDPDNPGEGTLTQMSPDGSSATIIEYYFDNSGFPRWRYLAVDQSGLKQGNHYVGIEYAVTLVDASSVVTPRTQVELTMFNDRIEIHRDGQTKIYVVPTRDSESKFGD